MGELTRRNKNWTPEEDDYLRENVGKKRLELIGKHLKRSGRAVQDRLVHLGMSHTTFATGMFTAAAIANALNTDSHVPLRWINKYGLKAIRKTVCFEASYWFIKPKDFWDWAEAHKELINFAKIKKNGIPPEPAWVDVERENAIKNIPKKHKMKWTPEEDKQLIRLFDRGLSYEEICKEMNRNYSGITHRLSRLKKNLKINLKWTEEEINIMYNLEAKGFTDKEIAYELGREACHISDKRRRLREKGIYKGHKYERSKII